MFTTLEQKLDYRDACWLIDEEFFARAKDKGFEGPSAN
jgi:hypothetical protein